MALGVLATPAAAAPDADAVHLHPQQQPPQPLHDEYSVLVFSKTAGFRHDSIPAGIAAIRQLGADHHFAVTATEDAAAFTDENLAQYAAVVWLSTTGDVLDAAQQAAFERYIAAGGGYVGVHAASDTEYSWPWYGDLVGAYFASHPQIQPATITVTDEVHPSTATLPQRWSRTDEWYNFQDNPRGDVHVLAALDESTYDPGAGAMGHDHPISWCQNYEGGRAWYTGIGHTAASYAEPEALAHLLGGIETAAGRVEADCGATVEGSFDQVTLARGEEKTGEPIAMAVLPDGRVLHTSRDGRVWLTTPQATTSLAARIPVYTHDEDGLQGVAIDPGFATNRWVYLYYAPPLSTPAGDAPTDGPPSAFEPFRGHNQLSRYRLLDDGTLDLASEQQILQVPADRGICCHAGGEIDFDAQGNLYLSTGDDTNPFASDGYTPIDERATRNPAFDAQRSSANTNDLRGKIIRITVGEDGSYTVPAGNLFAPGTAQTRPEIYAMGFRNPFRFAVDRATGVITLGDYGPDAGAANPARGPGGTVEFNRISGPGNFGWPYCTGDQLAYVDYQFPSGPSGATFDCASPVNTSPNNTGLQQLPPAQAAWLPYDGGSRPEFGSGSESPMGGPTYRYDPELESQTKWPAYYDGKPLIYEWERSWIKAVTVDDATGAALKIDPVFESMDLVRPMNVEFGPDGSLYVLDYGTGYFGGSPESAVYRVDYTQGTRAPRVELTATPTSGTAPLTVQFDPAGTEDPDGDEITYAWDFTSDGVVDATTAGPVSHTYTDNGQYTARLTVTDATGREASATAVITVGNTAPTVELVTPPDGGVFDFGDTVPFQVTVTDPEDGAAIDCSRVVVEYILGHDDHGHPLSRATGCSGNLPTVADEGHGPDSNVFGVINATYTDGGAPGLPALTGEDEAVLQPREKQAEFHQSMSGIQIVAQPQARGGKRVGYIDAGDWIAFDPVSLQGVTGIGYRVSSGGAGGVIEVRSGAVDGPLVQSTAVPSTGGWDDYVELAPTPITDPGGTAPLYLVFSGTGTGGLFDVDAVRFTGGVGIPPDSPCDDLPAPPGPDDEFDGTELDRCRWTTIVRHDPAGHRVAGGALEIDAQPGDMYNGAVDAKNLVLQDAPDGSWTATTRMSITGTSDYVQGGLLLHSSDQDFAKAVLIHMPGVGWRVENGYTVDGASVADQSGALPAGIEQDAWLRMSSDGTTLVVSVSADGATWQQVGPARSLAAIPDPRVGVAAFHGVAGERARFDSFAIETAAACTPQTPEPGYRSLFDGTAASTEAWSQAGPGGFDLVDCELRSRGGLGLLWHEESFDAYSLKLDWMLPGDDNSGVFVGFPNPGTDPWVAVDQGHEVQIDATDAPDRTTGAIYAFRSADVAARDAALNPPGEWNTFEIVVTGDRIRVLLNGVLINDYTDTDPNRMNAPSFVGIQNHGADDDVRFRNIRIAELDVTAPTTVAATTPDEPNGSDGWHRAAPVTVTLTATDPGGAVASTEFRVDGGAWTAYTGPFEVSGDGTHTVEYRSTDTAGNVEATRSLEIRIDAAAPVVTVSGVTADRVYGDATDLVVGHGATDATSGVATVRATLDGAALAPGSLVALHRLPLGVHTLRVVATDRAGNRTVRVVSFATSTSMRDIGQLLDRFRATNRLSAAAHRVLADHLGRARTAEANGNDAKALRHLRDLRAAAADPQRVPDAEVRATLTRDADAVITLLEGATTARAVR